jgi:hypothetical protein
MAQALKYTVGSTSLSNVMAVDGAASIVARGAGAVGLAAIALIHVLDAPGTYVDHPYIFVLYLGLIAGCLGTAALLLRSHARLGWAATLAMSSLPFIAFVLSRATGLPGDADDIGNWTESLGMASLFVEGCVFALGLYGLNLLKRAA